MTTSLSMTPSQAAKQALLRLPAKRMREVLERRFGLKGGARQTLEEIGTSYHITRERVRQIEADALRRLRAETAGERDDFLHPVEDELARHGAVMAEQHLFETIAPARFHPHLRFLMHIASRFHFIPENDAYHPRWALRADDAEKAEALLTRVTQKLQEEGRPVPRDTLHGMLAAGDGSGNETLGHRDTGERAAPSTSGNAGSETAESLLRASRLIKRNPYGEYGLVSWPTISPRGIRDKAYAVLAKSAKPLHFREVAVAIDRAGWQHRKKAHPQTVHNELIKDNRFVLVGRGLYALREWGYESGTVRDVLVSLFKSHNRPLDRQEIVQLAGEQRMVKPQTILLNLQDRDLFKRTDDGKYTLV